MICVVCRRSQRTNDRAEWQKACHRSVSGRGDQQRRFTGAPHHDLRCSAAMNFVDTGFPEDAVGKIGSWRTRAMFSRYNVMNTERIGTARVKGGEHVDPRITNAK